MALINREQAQSILIVEDEISICEMLEIAMKKWGYKTNIANNVKDAKTKMERNKYDLILSDIKLPDGTGVEVLERVKGLPEKPPVILMTAFGNTDSAVQAMNLGAFYYLTKPFKLDEMKVLIDRALEGETLKKENEILKTEVKKDFTVASIVGKSKVMKSMFEMIERVAATKTNVLITGESGTGKELVARAIHYGGLLKNKPFVAVNCGAIPENLIESELFGHKRGSFTGAVSDKDGLFRVADGGSIFLDEIGELPAPMQVKLLRVLQDRTFRPVGGNENIKVDIRIISATNRNLEEEVAKGRFREDLFYRLNVINIKTPPLRERKEDIEDLINHFLRKFSLGIGKTINQVSSQAMKAFLNYSFPGNVRELENMMERAVALEGTGEITLESLTPAVQAAYKMSGSETQARDTATATANTNTVKNAKPTDFMVVRSKTDNEKQFDRKKLFEEAAKDLDSGNVNLDDIVNDLEREFVMKALEKTNGVKKKAAELLGITFRSIRYRINKLGIDDKESD